MQMNFISSISNPAIKEVKLLKSRKGREDKQLFFIEGVRIVEEAFEAEAEIVSVFISEQYQNIGSKLTDMLEKSECIKYSVTDKVFREISDTETPQGILAVLKIQKRALAAEAPAGGLYVVLDSVRDPGNMGTIIRTADAAGFTGVIACKGCVDVYNPKVLRSTMGSIFHISIFIGDEITDVLPILKAGGIKVYASHLKGTTSIFRTVLAADAALVIGSEADGISDETASAADFLVKIPMPGRAESLNASVAAAVMIYESVRQRESI